MHRGAVGSVPWLVGCAKRRQGGDWGVRGTEIAGNGGGVKVRQRHGALARGGFAAEEEAGARYSLHC